jgi:hypothetical protein
MAVSDPPRWPRDIPLYAKIGTNFAGGHSIGIVRSRTQAVDFAFLFYLQIYFQLSQCHDLR